MKVEITTLPFAGFHREEDPDSSLIEAIAPATPEHVARAYCHWLSAEAKIEGCRFHSLQGDVIVATVPEATVDGMQRRFGTQTDRPLKAIELQTLIAVACEEVVPDSDEPVDDLAMLFLEYCAIHPINIDTPTSETTMAEYRETANS